MMRELNTFRTTAGLLIALVATSLLNGCQTNPKQLQSFLSQGHTPVGSSEYRVMPPDILTINARPAEEYKDLQVQVGPDGKAFLPLIGEFNLADKTTTQISEELTDRLVEYYQDVQVTVTVKQYLSQKFYVFGQVTRPGAYPYTGSDSLLSALADAQPTTLALPEQIQLVRGTKATQGGFMPDMDAKGKPKADAKMLVINLDDMTKKGDMSANVLLACNDVIYVPPNPLAAVGLAVQNLLFPVRPAADVAIAPTSAARSVAP